MFEDKIVKLAIIYVANDTNVSSKQVWITYVYPTTEIDVICKKKVV